MRIDQPASAAAAEREHALQYANRWCAIEPWVRIYLGSNHSTESYQELRDRHMSRLLLLHQSLGINMKIISRHALDDPRLTEPEMRARLQQYRERRDIYDSMKHKRKKGGAN